MRGEDLTGKTIGALTVIRLDGSGAHGDRTYLCKCSICGGEKVFPASSIKMSLKSCGCEQYNSGRMKSMSKDAVKKTVVDGVQLNSVYNQNPMRNNKTGLRGVIMTKNGTYRAHCQVKGERWIKEGFPTKESAKLARDKKQKELLEKYHVPQKDVPPGRT